MVTYTDFKNGLTSADDYLSAERSIGGSLNGSFGDVARIAVSAEMDFTLKEVICSLLAGRGLLLPNIQICISINLKALLGELVGKIQDALYKALQQLEDAYNKFMEHLKIDEVLGRINNVLAEITSIANMINFCSAPIDPIQIPNVLEDAMQSFLGKGKALIDSLGGIIPDEITWCLGDDGGSSFKRNIWNGGIMKKFADNYDDLDSIQDTLIADINKFVTDVNELIDSERSPKTSYSTGGSDLREDERPVHEGIGVLYNADDEGIQGAVRNGSSLWSAYQQLGSYQVIDSDGNVYDNIFATFVDDDLLRILRRTPNPTPEISERTPVYNYCGEIIGYTNDVSQVNPTQSSGSEPQEINQPGFNAGGLSTSPLTSAQERDDELDDTIDQTNDLAEQVEAIEDRLAIIGTATTINEDYTDVTFDAAVTPTEGTAHFVDIMAVAKRTDAAGVMTIKHTGLVNNFGGSVTSYFDAGDKIVYNQITGYDIQIVVVDDELIVRVKGDTGNTVSWTVKYNFTEA